VVPSMGGAEKSAVQHSASPAAGSAASHPAEVGCKCALARVCLAPVLSYALPAWRERAFTACCLQLLLFLAVRSSVPVCLFGCCGSAANQSFLFPWASAMVQGGPQVTLPSAALLLPWLALCQSADCGAFVSFQPSCLLLWTVLKAHC